MSRIGSAHRRLRRIFDQGQSRSGRLARARALSAETPATFSFLHQGGSEITVVGMPTAVNAMLSNPLLAAITAQGPAAAAIPRAISEAPMRRF